MSSIRVTKVQHPSSATANIELDSAGNFSGAGLDLVVSNTFSGSQLVIDNCFTNKYKNYRIVMTAMASTNGLTNIRLRAGGVTDLNANYSVQTNLFANTTFTGAVSTAQTSFINALYFNTSQYLPVTMDIFGPSDPTSSTYLQIRAIMPDNGIATWLVDGYHSTASAYDGLLIIPQAGTIGGQIKIYGYHD